MRTLLVILVAFTGITAMLFGMLLIAYPVLGVYGLSMEFLHPAFVKSYTLPGFIFILVGSIYLWALFCIWQRNRTQYNWSLAGCSMMISWLIVHSFFLETIPWLYFTYGVGSLFIILLVWQLKGRWAV